MSEVLVFIDWYLPGYRAGGPVTSCANMVDALRNDFRFSIVTSDRDYCAESPYADIEPNKWVSRAPNERVLYLSPKQQTRRKMQELIAASDAQTVYINGVYSLRFSIWPLLALWRAKSGKRVVVAGRGMLARSAIGVKRGKKTVFLKMARLLGLYRGVVFHATNEVERDDILREIGGNTQVAIAPNIPRKPSEQMAHCAKEHGSLRLVSVARIAPEKNLLFLLESLKAVRSKIYLTIYGSVYDDAYWQQCRAAMAVLPKNVEVSYNGFAEPHDVPAVLQSHHVLVLPSRGENYGHIIAESFLSGRPVLISDQTPWRGLASKKAGMDLPLQSETFSTAIDQFAAMEAAAFERWLAGARQQGAALSNDPKPVQAHRTLLKPQSAEASA